MPRGPLGGPRPLLSQECGLTVRDYTAIPSPTLSGDTTPDRTETFREIARSYLPIRSFTTQRNETREELGDVLVANLDTDRLQFDEWFSFLKAYADQVDVSDLRKLSVGITGSTRTESRMPRPLAEADIIAVDLIEIRVAEYTNAERRQVSEQLRSTLSWVVDTSISGETILLQHQGGVNNLVSSQSLELVDQLDGSGVPATDVTITCSLIEQ